MTASQGNKPPQEKRTKKYEEEREVQESNIKCVENANSIANKSNEGNENNISKGTEMTVTQGNNIPSEVVVVNHDRNKDCEKKTFEETPEVNKGKNSCMIFNQRFLHQMTLFGRNSLEQFAPKEWLNHSNFIDHPFNEKLKTAKNKAIKQVLRR